MKIHCHYFLSWPIDEALTFMHKAWLCVNEDPSMVEIGCGSHKTVITVGRQANACEHIFTDVAIRNVDRGGGLTAHEPGQLVLYPVFNLHHLELTVPSLIDLLESSTIDFLDDIGLKGHRHATYGPGIFIGEQKIGFIGLRIKERIVQHGLAINLKNDANIFKRFDPCGIKSLPITSACFHTTLSRPFKHYAERLVYFFLRNLGTRTQMGTSLDVGVLLKNATDRSGTSTLPSGK